MTLVRQSFLEVFQDVSGGNAKVRRSDLLESGSVPVVDQGKQLIAGFTNDLKAICKVEPPVIIFGDHTRALKYVDFPFAMGTDGTKVLKSKSNHHLPYLFHFLRSIHIPEAGYSRHFKFFKELQVPVPDLAEQRRIAEILDKADELKAKRQQAIDELDKLQQAVFLDMFGDPVANPKGWDEVPLISLCDEVRGISYGIVQRGRQAEGGVPILRIKDILADSIDEKYLVRCEPEIAAKYKRTELKGGELVISIRGTVGAVKQVPPSLHGSNISRELAVLPLIRSADARFVQAVLQSAPAQSMLTNAIKGVAQRSLNLSDLKDFKIVQPPPEQQSRFSHVDKTIEVQRNKLLEHQKGLQELFMSLQSNAFNVEI